MLLNNASVYGRNISVILNTVTKFENLKHINLLVKHKEVLTHVSHVDGFEPLTQPFTNKSHDSK